MTLIRDEALATQLDPLAGAGAVASRRASLLVWTLTAALAAGGALLVPFEETVQLLGEARLADVDALVQAPSAGVVKEVLVKPGEFVLEGQELVRLSTPELDAALLKAQSEAGIAQSQAQPALIQAEGSVVRKIAQQEEIIRLTQAKVARARAERARQETLLGAGLVSKANVEQAAGLVDEALVELTKAQQSMAALQTERLDARRRLGQDLGTPQASLDALNAQVASMVLRAKKAGKVEWVGTLAGRPLRAGDAVVRVVPENPHLEFACIAPVDELGKMRPGQRVRLEFDGFLPGDFGRGTGVIASIGRDVLSLQDAQGISPLAAVGSAYVQVKVQPTDFAKVHPEPGLRTHAKAILGRRSLFSRFIAKIG